MSTRKTTTERINDQKAKMEQMQKEMQLLKRRHNAEERKKRNHRISHRGAHMESILPDTIKLSDGRFYTFLEKTVGNDFGRRALATLVAEQAKEDAENGNAAATQDADAPAAKTETTAQGADATPAAKATATAQTNGKTPEPAPTQPPQGGGAPSATKSAEANRQGA